MYNISEEVLVENKQTYINTGISENLELSHRAVMSDKDNPFLEYVYTNDKGQRVTRTEYSPNPMNRDASSRSSKQNEFVNKIQAENDNCSDEKACEIIDKMTTNSQMKRILNVAKQFISLDEIKGQNFNTFYEFATFISNKLAGTPWTDDKGITRRKRSEKLRVKFVYDNKGYVNTPEYINSNIWIERMDQVSKEDSVIELLANDKLERTSVSGTRAPRSENPLEDSSSKTNQNGEKDDLPF
jgi:hypothetical protein